MQRTETAIHTLYELANRESEKAAKDLKMSSDQLTKAQLQVEMLEGYRAEYMTQHAALLTNSVQSSELLNFRDFVKNLDQTIMTQQQMVDRAKLLAQDKRVKWQQCELKKLSYQVLTEKQAQLLLMKEQKMEQILTDEFVNTSTAFSLQKKSM